MKKVIRLMLAVVAAVCTLTFAPIPLPAATLPYADGFIGQLQEYRVRNGESLIEIARRFDLGFNEIVAANPGRDPFVTRAGSLVIIPTAWILPALPSRPALVVNLPELRLYYFPNKRSSTVLTYPLGIGDQGTDTPVGNYTIVEKIAGPAWYVPASIRRHERRLPKVVPPGPGNPMGSHALRLSLESILIHGTNKPWGVGRRSSHGCLRLYPEDIISLFRAVPKGMRVAIVNQPIKVGSRGNRLYLEAHHQERWKVAVGQAINLLAERKLLSKVDFGKLIRAVENNEGVPVDITLDFLEPYPPTDGKQMGKKPLTSRAPL